MTFRLGDRLAATIATVWWLGASTGHAQGPTSESAGAVQLLSAANPGNGYGVTIRPHAATGPLYVACWADAPSQGTVYFSATFAAQEVWKARKEFRKLLIAHYGPVSQPHCAGKFSSARVQELVQQWKEAARAATDVVVDTSWEP
ncbi:MAG TPA: hypothetical protein VHH11_01220 [Gammaproteobacteria bacterium]|nr:hypothetical protein [Gammaproteobacteria bacterium]